MLKLFLPTLLGLDAYNVSFKRGKQKHKNSGLHFNYIEKISIKSNNLDHKNKINL
jgi:hypothetical protein